MMVRYLFVASCPVNECLKQDKPMSWQCIHDGTDMYINEHGYLSCENYSHVAHICNWRFECGEKRGPHKHQKRQKTDFEGFSHAVIQGQPYIAKEAGTLWMKKLIESLEIQFGMIITQENARRGKSPGRLRARAISKKIQSPRTGFAGQHLFYVTCPLSTCLGRNRLYYWECMEDQTPLYIDEEGWLTCETYSHRAQLFDWTFDCGDRRGSHGYRKFVESDFEGVRQAMCQGLVYFDAPEDWMWPVIDSIAQQYGYTYLEDKYETRARGRSEMDHLFAASLKGEDATTPTSANTTVHANKGQKQEEKEKATESDNVEKEKKDGGETNTVETKSTGSNSGGSNTDKNSKKEDWEDSDNAGNHNRVSTASPNRVEDKIVRYINRAFEKSVLKDKLSERESIPMVVPADDAAEANRLRQVFVYIQKNISKNWKSVLRSLPWPAHFDDSRLEREIVEIVKNNSDDLKEQAYQGLLMWRSSYPRASELKLFTALRNCEFDSLVEDIVKMQEQIAASSKSISNSRAPSEAFSVL